MRRRTLEPPVDAAHPFPRAHFDPKSGWFRRIERAASLFLSRSVYPRVPGMWWPYDRMLLAGLTVAETDVDISGLPRPLDGTKVLFVSDLHAGPFLSAGAVAAAFARLRALGADVVIHGGDLATSSVGECLPHAEAIAGLSAPLGAYAVYGNHDHYTRDLPGVRALYERCGVRLLANDAVALERAGGRIALAGIDDWNIGTPDLDRALAAAARVAPGAPVLLASHNPDAFLDAARRGVALVLAGHTHGGQVRIPGRPVLVRMSRYRLDEGRYRAEGSHLIVSRGIGVSGLPVRLFCPPEVLLVTLKAAP